MKTFDVMFRWNGLERVERVVCNNVAEASNLIRARYEGAYVTHVWEVVSQ